MLWALVSIIPETNTSPLKINGWTMKFLFGARPIFRGEILVSGSVIITVNHFGHISCSRMMMNHLKCWDQNHPNILMFYGLCRPIPLLTLQNSKPPQNSVHMIFCKGGFSYTSTDCNQKPLHSPQNPSNSVFRLLKNIPAMKVAVLLIEKTGEFPLLLRCAAGSFEKW